ncbi:hypothetical protein M2451_001436 [Dysgonomonas sp. PFB1-18]|uniref:DUF3945 domain-containing protein n=1 Tax=unclassified Dysgonomonas TaxID=2630389 RepID=UPI002475E77B|nr:MULTISPECIES: DUF3945 domain-containing protein [unclassified Dysgonomonas]MDH6308870.1 hypothetical protein [Dysgonomonas sp. PF1-14]MDH6338434.1 hypothetical protein [Dysgonomonas sp. PF1-16]MDH6380119.1 hypothetical protein [Dysgonomonas sp. PFB1-18]MDH6397262.1 hypothetical protein [Dysgonomonas sp. PF1-23]
MAEEDTRADTKGKAVFNDQLHDILLVMDMEEMTLKAVKDIDKNGKMQITDAEKGMNNNFLNIDQNGNLVDNFLKNFYRQAKDPTRFQFFKVPVNKLKETVQSLKELFKADPSSKSKKVAEQYKVDPEEGIQKKQDEKPGITNQNENSMAKATTENAPTQQGPRTRFNEAMINWDELGKLGISKEYLQEKNMLDGMLRGYKSRETVPINLNVGSAVIKTDARLSFQQSKAGPVVMAIHGIRKEPELDRPYFGHIFSEEDKKNLKESGNMGRVVPLQTRNGEYAPSFISIDKLTNEVVGLRVENINIPNEIKDVKLTEQEKENLKEGKAVYIEGMKSASGKEFDAHIQINAEKRGIEFIFQDNKLFNSQSIGGVELTTKQVADLNMGKAIFVEDMTRKDGEKFSSFVKLDEGSGRPNYTRYNPDSSEGSREIYVPKEMHGVQLTPQDRGDLRQGKPVFLENMVNRKGEEFSSFVKLDLETGKPSYSKTPDGFTERQEFRIPAELWGVSLSATQLPGLQDGKAVLVENMTGFNGQKFSNYVKVNQNQGRLDYYEQNPDRNKKAEKSDVVAKQNQKEEKKQDKKQSGKQENKPKRGKGIS